MKKLIAVVLMLALFAVPAQAGNMAEGGTWGMVELGAAVTINPSFGYYPVLKGVVGVDRFLITGSLGGVIAGEQPEQVVGVEGAFQLIKFAMPFDREGDGQIALYLMGGVSSAQGSYNISFDEGQYRVGPKFFFNWDALSPTANKVQLTLAVPFMGAKVLDESGIETYNVTYFAVEGAIVFDI